MVFLTACDSDALASGELVAPPAAITSNENAVNSESLMSEDEFRQAVEDHVNDIIQQHEEHYANEIVADDDLANEHVNYSWTSSAMERVIVARVIDGDTIDVLLNGETERIRFIGIDTPERGEPGFSEATDFVRDAIENSNNTVFLLAEGRNEDRWGRLRRIIFLEDGTNLNCQLVEYGFATRLVISGDRPINCENIIELPQVSESNNGAQEVSNDAVTNLININTASAIELQSLRGIGPALAKRIIEFRENDGLFTQVDDLLAVRGIGIATVDAIRSEIAVY